MKLVSLNRKRELRQLRQRHLAKANLVHDARSCHDEIDGYAIVTFQHIRDETGTICRSNTLYWVRDTIDAHRLPELARSQLQRVIAASFDPKPRNSA